MTERPWWFAVPERQRGYFLKGPVPLRWLQHAARLPSPAFIVGIGIWFWSGMRKSSTVRVSGRMFPLPLSRYAVYRGLSHLETAGLIVMRRRHGHPAIVTLALTPLHRAERKSA